MTARFWRRATIGCAVPCIVAGLVWCCLLVWAPTLETVRDHGWLGHAVAVLSVLSCIANELYRVAARAGR